MTKAGIISIVYGAIIAMGGVMGFAMAHSKKSLLTGLLGGLLLIGFGVAMRGGNKAAWSGAVAVTAVIMLFFGSKYLAHHQMMPAGSTLIISVVALFGLLVTARPTKTA